MHGFVFFLSAHRFLHLLWMPRHPLLGQTNEATRIQSSFFYLLIGYSTANLGPSLKVTWSLRGWIPKTSHVSSGIWTVTFIISLWYINTVHSIHLILSHLLWVVIAGNSKTTSNLVKSSIFYCSFLVFKESRVNIK